MQQLRRQRRVPFPHSSLLEPHLATPSTNRPQQINQSIPRFGRVHALDAEEELLQHDNSYELQQSIATQKPADKGNAQRLRSEAQQTEKEDWHQRVLELTEQVNALRLRQDSKEDRSHRSTQHQQPRQTAEQHQQQTTERRPGLTCWNCDEDGHRFMDCPKPQAVMFCYRCGHKGYSLRNCLTCRSVWGNGTAGNH